MLDESPYRDALDVARLASFTAEELEVYDRAKVAEQDARGALSLAAREGHERGRAEGRAEGREEGLAEGRTEGRAEGLEEGRAEGLEEGRAEGRAEDLRDSIRATCRIFEFELDADREAALTGMRVGDLEALQERILRDSAWR